jgi:hypothetical protein
MLYALLNFRESSMGQLPRVFFRIGSWACVTAAAIHLLGQVAPRPAPQNPTEETLVKLLNTYQKNYGAGFHRSMSDFWNGFGAALSPASEPRV